MVNLNLAALAAAAPSVQTPTYDPLSLTCGIVHFGVGGFHRSHEAMYLDRLLNLREDHDWGICGVGVLPADARMRDVLAAQDHLYTLLTTSPDGHTEARVIGAIRKFLFAPDDPEAVLEQLADPATRIVSLTVTEGGYAIDNGTGLFDPSGSELQHDLTPGAVPRTVFGFITEGLRRRRARGLAPFTVVSCDNMQGNGDVTRLALTSFARLKDPELGEWLAAQVAFPNSMVDRITPVTTEQTQQDVTAATGLDDAWPVLAESFTQWVLEDHFTLGRPALEQVGVQLVTDVEPYELMKLRLLNASHQAMGCLGLLAGWRYVHEVCEDPALGAFVLGYMTAEATPTLRPVPGIDLGTYRQELMARFGSRAIQDTLARLVVDASERIPKFLLPVVREQLSRGGEIRHAALVLAAWSAYLRSAEAQGQPITDVHAPLLLAAAQREDHTPAAFLDVPAVFGDLGQHGRLRTEYLSAQASLRRLGPQGAAQAVNDAMKPLSLAQGPL
ncbi:mannitol dehydrogenase family protein [Deinococcus sp. HMF7604]|uniref:mannitol dehydrogenase family protein n=1 Tax=Deinococcus betulae TaxID=2873312 RepID=UPI001CC90605|nr:mannitol dehydrogenase family protein [Deinococcus betulae]MBZ9750163.1 mannitol dehydrogenase family protein [Deinococcus betulae]